MTKTANIAADLDCLVVEIEQLNSLLQLYDEYREDELRGGRPRAAMDSTTVYQSPRYEPGSPPMHRRESKGNPGYHIHYSPEALGSNEGGKER